MNMTLRNAALSLAATVLFAAAVTSSQAATIVQVSLWDKGADTPMATGLVYQPGDEVWI